MSHRFREINAVGTEDLHRDYRTRFVASLPRDQRCWHDLTSLGQLGVFGSHRFREINAVGTVLQAKHTSNTLKSHRFREINAVGTNCAVNMNVFADGRIASERSTLLAQESRNPAPPTDRSHRFREINAVGTISRDPRKRRRGGRIASERSTLLAPCYTRHFNVRHVVASLPRDQRCWHGYYHYARDNGAHVASLPRDQRCWHNYVHEAMGLERGRIASERSTLLAQICNTNTSATRENVASLPRDQRCWHITNAFAMLGTSCRIASERSTLLAPRHVPQHRHDGHRRIASERSTLLALVRQRLSEQLVIVASLPRDQRCWHIETQTIELAKSSRIASERSTLLARDQGRTHSTGSDVASLPRDQRCWHTSSMGTQDVPFRSHRFREINAVGTVSFPTCMYAYMQSHRFREINAVGTGLQGPACVRAESHRFREINAVGTRRSSTGCSCAAFASLPRDQRCWHVLKESKNLGKVCRIASERSTLLAPIWRRSNRRFPRGRIASERSTLLAHNIAVVGIIEVPSHRFREINAVGTSSATTP